MVILTVLGAAIINLGVPNNSSNSHTAVYNILLLSARKCGKDFVVVVHVKS